jgi:glycosyltransferase involved in cell wall biosynthesis
MFDAGEPSGLRRRLGVGEAPLVMYTGTLDRFQRLDYLLRAMVRVVAHVPAARLVLAVNMAKQEDIEWTLGEARSLGVAERMILVHPMTLEELPTFLAAADVAVCPRPACPGFPVKVLNYMAARKPIVTARGSAKGLRHLETAFVADDHDWEGLADGIITLLEEPALAKRLGEEARASIVGTFDWESLAARIESVYDRLV